MISLKWLNHIPVRIKLTAWYLLLLGLTLGGFTGYLYFRLERKIISKADTALQIAGSQSLVYLNDQGNALAFADKPSRQNTAQRLIEAGFAVRLITPQGKIVDGFGKYQEVPLWIPSASGYIRLARNKADWRLISQPVIRQGQIIGWLQIAKSLEALEEISQELPREMLFTLPLILVLAGCGGLFLSSKALQPISQITQTAQDISAIDLAQRLNYKGAKDEVGQLATTFDQMLERLQAGFEREQRFTADAAHELRTPLTVIKGRIDVTRSQERTPDEYEQTLQDLEQEVDRLIRLSNGLLLLARIDRGQLPFEPLPVDLNNLLEVIVEQVQHAAESQQIKLLNNLTPDLWVQGDPDQLTSLFLNLVDNAVKYTPLGGVVWVRSNLHSNVVQVMIINTGVGIAKEHLPHLFERFYRADSARFQGKSGSGLGLAIAHEIARLHGGTITADSIPNKETTFTVTLPAQHTTLPHKL
ncbi:sensor histidine kinase [Iningainema tapete]|uniref:histidine kinase n=1 Tax=Iningainema tapete BLCC-T55 TaxID=2748662 RepID=A0A8J7CI23_9CYAN|nr:ATP-binding protein [Iningainema tapete]MBD2778500.1 HAMP domain-containing protein [Iningainema tapete BLCC-T55]